MPSIFQLFRGAIVPNCVYKMVPTRKTRFENRKWRHDSTCRFSENLWSSITLTLSISAEGALTSARF